MIDTFMTFSTLGELMAARADLSQELIRIGRAHDMKYIEQAARNGARAHQIHYLNAAHEPRYRAALTAAGFRVTLEEPHQDEDSGSWFMSGTVSW